MLKSWSSAMPTIFFEDPPSNERYTDRAALIQYYQQLFSLPEVSFSDFTVLEGEHFATIE